MDHLRGRLPYEMGRALAALAVRVCFRRFEVRNLARLPSHGPLLIVSNDPAAMTDALVLATSLRRRIHFLAMNPLIRPWIRGALKVLRRELRDQEIAAATRAATPRAA